METLRPSCQEPLRKEASPSMRPKPQLPTRGSISRPHGIYSLWLQGGQGGLDFHKAQEDPEREKRKRDEGKRGASHCLKQGLALLPSRWVFSTSRVSAVWPRSCLQKGSLDAWPCAQLFLCITSFYLFNPQDRCYHDSHFQDEEAAIHRVLQLSQVTWLLRDKPQMCSFQAQALELDHLSILSAPGPTSPSHTCFLRLRAHSAIGCPAPRLVLPPHIAYAMLLHHLECFPIHPLQMKPNPSFKTWL